MEKKALNEKLNNASNVLNNIANTKTPATKKPTVSEVFNKFVATHPQMAIYKDGKQYLKAEAWQYLLGQLGLFPSCDCISMVHTNEKTGEQEFKGVKVEVTLTSKEGLQLCKSMMVARTDEDWLKDKPEYAVYGMAQTRAISRAARNVYGWVAVEAGFEATPWDEMPR